MHNNTCLNKKSQPLVCSVKTPEGKLQVNMLHDFSHYTSYWQDSADYEFEN